MSIGGHQGSVSGAEEWLTPPHIIQALGPFDLDPCACADRPWDTAYNHYTIEQDGLSREWSGRVWLNPPYGRKTAFWLRRLADHGNGIALMFARTETAMFFESVWPKATALLFIEGRLYFYFSNGRVARANCGAPSVLIAYGEEMACVLERCGIGGAFVRLAADGHL